MIQRTIPSSGEQLPVLGLGTWSTFDVSDKAYPALKKVLGALYNAGGRLIDSSPMYGRAEQVTGDLTRDSEHKDEFFYATKVWTTGKQEGIKQMTLSMERMGRKTMDLMQIHNLVDWKTHLQTLLHWKEQGVIRYIGITQYTESVHDELERLMKKEDIDFVQFNYSILSRNAEKRLLPAAAHHGVATIINRPFGEGHLFSKVAGKPLPTWADELGIRSWSAYFLKYIIADPAVSCAIPATGDPAHAAANYSTVSSSLPGEADRKKMIGYLESL